MKKSPCLPIAVLVIVFLLFLGCSNSKKQGDKHLSAASLLAENIKFEPAAGVYLGSVDVTITTDQPNVNIHYVTDESKPGCSSTPYDGSPINLTENISIKAILCDERGNSSEQASSNYTIEASGSSNSDLDPPTFNPMPTSAPNLQSSYNITITAASGATIHYRTDGVDPSCTSGSVYTTAIALASGTGTSKTLKALACKDNSQSDIKSATYTIAPSVNFSPNGGAGWDTYNVTINSSISGSTIRYTDNGQDPTCSIGTTYSQPVNLTSTTATTKTLKAVACKNNISSTIITADYGIVPTVVSIPSFNPDGGSTFASYSVTITATPGDAVIRYTTTGTAPTCSSGTIYSSPVTVTGAAGTFITLQAIACKNGIYSPLVKSAVYSFPATSTTPALPIFSPDGGSGASSYSVTITSESGTIIHSATGGSDPQACASNQTGTNNANTTIANSTSSAQTITLKARACRNGQTSQVKSADYLVAAGKAAKPTIKAAILSSPIDVTDSTATSSTPIIVSLECLTGGSTIKYVVGDPTIAAPTCSTSLCSGIGTSNCAYNYSQPVTINTSSVVKAVACRTGLTDSDISTATFTITSGGTVETPEFATTGDITSSTSPIDVTITSATQGAIITLLRNSSTGLACGCSAPCQNISNGAHVTISSTTTLYAVACKNNWNSSGIQEQLYTITGSVTPVTFTPVGGTNRTVSQGSFTVNMSTATSGATICYRKDGNDPVCASNSNPAQCGLIGPSDTGALQGVSSWFAPTVGSYTIKAKGCKYGWTPSGVTSATYNVYTSLTPASDPVFSVAAGEVSTGSSVSITSTGANIVYTTGGTSDPSCGSGGSPSPVSVTINAPTTIKAIACKTGYPPSAVKSASYTIASVPAPQFSIAGAIISDTSYNFTNPVDVAIQPPSYVPGGSIRYTISGNQPTCTNCSDGGCFNQGVHASISQTKTLKALVIIGGSTSSPTCSDVTTVEFVKQIIQSN